MHQIFWRARAGGDERGLHAFKPFRLQFAFVIDQAGLGANFLRDLRQAHRVA